MDDAAMIKSRRPVFGGLSLGVPLLGLNVGFFAAINAPPSTGDNWNFLIILGFSSAFALLCGVILAIIGLIRREQLIVFSWSGLILNLMPLLWIIGKAGIFPARLG